MEPESQKLKNLNPMFYWKNVIQKFRREQPEIRIILDDFDEKQFSDIISGNKEIIFKLENDTKKIQNFPNLYTVWLNNNLEDNRIHDYKTTDYLVCDDTFLCLQAQLNGVEIIRNLDELQQKIPQIRVRNSIERIETWEKAREVLTKLK